MLFDDFDTESGYEERSDDYTDYLDELEHEENSRAVDYHLEGVDGGHQVKGWYQ